MATLILMHHRVENYAAWRPVFDDHGAAQRDATLTSPKVYRNVSDPNDLTILFDIGDVATVRSFIASDDLKNAMQRAGVVDKGKFHIIE
jgi:hypothetical protein